ncbi:multiple sugar transport system permease protein [Paenibacillus sp. UNCCL117]|uniref:carbohydrate ABC transporter permease n=1 Tax=unclassified Paenibacillus TaxID=185978 RepID=UPI0008842BD6|nr:MULTISPECIES: sugar ABC transporter permease [unclassified Paenibacillus]SDC63519.1 carbohydrate ABC transporter membrane protein 1, CUT1 family [Paenibacillus sp. cl123]SFW22313.1 multiple sugar transport system permease protein [Paenibacillus sp. UNCCL117]
MKVKYKASALRRQESLAGFLFVSPMLIGVTVLTLLPIIATFVLSFGDWNFVAGLNGFKWVGLDNFTKLFADDSFLISMRNNFIFLLTVPIYLAISMVLAILINKYVYMKGFFKVAYFMPYISNVVAVAIVWQVLFHPSAGPVNQFLMSIGIDNPPKWIADPAYALLSVMMISVWISIGYNMIIYLAGLQSIPKDLYEAADIDGANAWVQFRSITLPMLSSTTFFLLITGIISTFKVFDLIAVLTAGGPIQSTSMLVWYLYETAFINLRIGYASSMAVVLFGCVLIITLLQWLGQKKWVNY